MAKKKVQNVEKKKEVVENKKTIEKPKEKIEKKESNSKKFEEKKENNSKKVEEREDRKKEKAVDEEFKDEKEKSTFSKVMNIVLWVVLFIWMGICLIDFFRVRSEHSPMFCISKNTTTYSDGTVDSCTGLGYKVYNYKRDSFKGIEFGPIWSKDRTAENK